jgi:hypothetical protein
MTWPLSSRNSRVWLPPSHRTSVKVLHCDGRQIDVFYAAKIDRRHADAHWINASAVRVDPAGRTETMLDDVLVELVGAGCLLWGLQLKLLSRNKP